MRYIQQIITFGSTSSHVEIKCHHLCANKQTFLSQYKVYKTLSFLTYWIEGKDQLERGSAHS